MEDDDDTSHLFSRTSRKVISEAQKELDQKLRDVGVTPSQQHGMRMPPPHTSAWQDRPPTPENVQGKQMQLGQPPNEPGLSVRADLGGHLKYSQRWSGVRAGVLLGAQGAVRRGENRGGL